jgi:hypothetical protein
LLVSSLFSFFLSACCVSFGSSIAFIGLRKHADRLCLGTRYLAYFAVARAVDGTLWTELLTPCGHRLSVISYRGTDHVLAIIDYQLFHKLARGQCLPEHVHVYFLHAGAVGGRSWQFAQLFLIEERRMFFQLYFNLMRGQCSRLCFMT